LYFSFIVCPFFPYTLKSIENEIDDLKYTDERGHQEILNREDYPEDHFIDARMTSEKSLLVEGGTLHSQSHNFDDSSLPGYNCMNKNTYPMMIKLIEGSLDGMDRWQSLFDTNTTSTRRL